ncbi:MAG: hypothetical protein PHX51_08340, partial [Clostridia bacterium]|nr:hypothetical protein [Clostridia bacterium]
MGDIADDLIEGMLNNNGFYNSAEYNRALESIALATRYKNTWTSDKGRVTTFENMELSYLYNTIKCLYNHFAHTHGLMIYDLKNRYDKLFRLVNDKEKALELLAEMLTEFDGREEGVIKARFAITIDKIKNQLDFYRRQNMPNSHIEIDKKNPLPPPPPVEQKIYKNTRTGKYKNNSISAEDVREFARSLAQTNSMDKGYRDVINDIADAIITESDIHDAIIASGVSIKKNFVEPAEKQFDVEMLGEEDENEDGFNASILSRIKALLFYLK